MHAAQPTEVPPMPRAATRTETVASAVTVDVGIPTRGTDLPHLVEAIESIFAQSIDGWRLFVSENGVGSEALRSTLEPYLVDPRVHHLVNGEIGGPGPNHTRAIRAGDAPFVGVLHDDDRWGPRFLESRVDFLMNHPTCGFVFSGHEIIDGTGRRLGRSKPALPEGVYSSEFFLPRLYRGNFIAPPAVVVRRSAYEAIGSEYADVVFCDHEMWLRLSAYFDVGCMAAWDAEYRLHASQTSSSRRLELAELQLEVIEAVDDLPLPGSVRRRELANAYARCALDDVERAERRRALGHMAAAVRSAPTALVRPRIVGRMAIGLAAMAFGERGRRALTRERIRRYQTRGTTRIA